MAEFPIKHVEEHGSGNPKEVYIYKKNRKFKYD